MKHLKLFQTETEYNAYKNGSDFVTPNVSYTVDSTKTFYSPPIEISEPNVGDICLANTNGDKKFIKVGDAIPDGYEPIGVVVIPSSHDVYGTGECAVLSLKYMSYSTPDEGSVSTNKINWGASTNVNALTNFTKAPYIAESMSAQTDITNPTIIGMESSVYLPSNNYTEITCGHDTSAKYNGESHKSGPSPYLTDGSRNPIYYQTSSPSTTVNVLSDFDGVGNTNVLIGLSTGQSDWKTATSITIGYTNGYYPAACCCWRYSTVGTNQGDWYLPACGELGYVVARLKSINNAIQYLKDSGFSDSCSLVDSSNSSIFWSSTEHDNERARYVNMDFGDVDYCGKYVSSLVRAFLRVK